MVIPGAFACKALQDLRQPLLPPSVRSLHRLEDRSEHLAELQAPTLILQGERDPFGKREEVGSYALSPQVQVGWIASGDHSFKPTKASGLSEAQNWATAVGLVDSFFGEVLHA